MSGRMVAILESGGTKMVAALSRGPGEIIAHEKIPTTTPEETIRPLSRVFRERSNLLMEKRRL
jgi:predicted NBD/HSP70 family sugar kinase